MKLKDIKLSSIKFPYIGIGGIEWHEYIYDKYARVLTFLIDGKFIEQWSGLEADLKIREAWEQKC